jgi:hypothetical protein
MGNSITKIEKLISEVERQPRLNYRLMLRLLDGKWLLQAMVADMHASSSDRFVHDYGEVAFIGTFGKGTRLAKWLRNLRGQTAGFKFMIPKLQDNAVSDRFPSHTRPDLFLGVREPFSLHRIGVPGRQENAMNNEPLVKAGCPSFSNLAEAAYSYLYHLQYRTGQREPDDIIIRLVPMGAWLELLEFQRNGLSITVGGNNVQGKRLEVSTNSNLRFDVKLRKSGRRRFAFPNGLPERVFVILSHGDNWMDYRSVELEGAKSSRAAGVLIEGPDVCTQIQGLIERGESDTREFKREIPPDRNNTFLKTVAAFANGKGGVILFGVVDDTGEIKGIKGDVQRQSDRVVNMIRDNVVPQPNLRVENCQLNGKRVLALFVEEGDLPPYGIDAAKPKFYVRRGATTFPANQAEVRAIAKKSFDSYSLDLLSF